MRESRSPPPFEARAPLVVKTEGPGIFLCAGIFYPAGLASPDFPDNPDFPVSPDILGIPVSPVFLAVYPYFLFLILNFQLFLKNVVFLHFNCGGKRLSPQTIRK